MEAEDVPDLEDLGEAGENVRADRLLQAHVQRVIKATPSARSVGEDAHGGSGSGVGGGSAVPGAGCTRVGDAWVPALCLVRVAERHGSAAARPVCIHAATHAFA